MSWPRGVYRIQVDSPHAFTLRLDGAAAGNFDVTDGYVYVAESSGKLIDGALFVTAAFRLDAPLPVPQTFDPPLNVRFRIEN